AQRDRKDRRRVRYTDARFLQRLQVAFRVALHQSAHLLRRDVQGPDCVSVLARERGRVLLNVSPDLVVLGQQTAAVAGHARDPRLHLAIGPLRITDDLDGRALDAASVAIDEHVALQAVGQVEDDLAAGLPERGAPRGWAERMLEDILAARVVAEVVTVPVGAV